MDLAALLGRQNPYRYMVEKLVCGNVPPRYAESIQSAKSRESFRASSIIPNARVVGVRLRAIIEAS